MMFLKIEELSLLPLLFLELILSAASDSNPVVIVHGERATFITGSVDYAIFSSISRAEELGTATLKDRKWLWFRGVASIAQSFSHIFY
jgi:hypothetical protein